MNTIIELSKNELDGVCGGLGRLAYATMLAAGVYFIVAEIIDIAYISCECDDWQEKKWSSKTMCYVGRSFFEGVVHGPGHFIPGMIAAYLLGVKVGEGHVHAE